MFPYSGRPTEEFLREYRNKLNELQELMESQGLKLEIKSGGRCIVVPEVKAGLGKVSGKDEGNGSDSDADNSFMLAYSQHYNAIMPRAIEEQEASDEDEATTATATKDATGTEAGDHDPAQTIIKPAESADDKQAPDEAKNGQSPFAHLSREELFDLIGINK
jgi:hypothetical protein